MFDFKQELNKLLEQETQPLHGDTLTEAALAEQKILASLSKKQSELSMQVEEIYDIVENIDTAALQEAMQTKKRRADTLAGTVVGLCDVLEDFCAYARDCGDAELDKQAQMMWSNTGRLLERSGFVRIGEVGQRLNPEIHTVRAATASSVPREYVAGVLQSGYRYMGAVARRAAVI